ncbi:MAG TPA: hypothetical protein VMM18_03180 [Gemmatimonadaceae bacterium]|nr:hypothetical protein [Gemmatimonadaceae bacterium]
MKKARISKLERRSALVPLFIRRSTSPWVTYVGSTPCTSIT